MLRCSPNRQPTTRPTGRMCACVCVVVVVVGGYKKEKDVETARKESEAEQKEWGKSNAPAVLKREGSKAFSHSSVCVYINEYIWLWSQNLDAYILTASPADPYVPTLSQRLSVTQCQTGKTFSFASHLWQKFHNSNAAERQKNKPASYFNTTVNQLNHHAWRNNWGCVSSAYGRLLVKEGKVKGKKTLRKTCSSYCCSLSINTAAAGLNGQCEKFRDHNGIWNS